MISNNEHIHVKLQFNDEFRRFFIPNPSTKFEELELKIKTLLPLSNADITLKYKDEEGEWITISSDDELETGLKITGKGQVFRLLCTIKNGSNNDNPTGPTLDSPTLTDQGEDTNPRWKRKWKKNYEKQENEITTDCGDQGGRKKWKESKQKREKREPKGGDKRRKKRKNEEEVDSTSSESNSDIALLTLDEIKVEVSKLKEEEGILKEKVRGAKENLNSLKEMVKEKRKDDKVQPDEILKLREELTIKKKEKKEVQGQLRNTRSRIYKLREVAETKQV